MPDVTPDFKPGKRKRANAKEWRGIHGHKTGPCRICGKAQTSLHHIIPRSQGGDDVTENIVPLCGDGTTGCHGLVENRDKNARGLLRAKLLVAELNYVVERQGAHWLNKNYPHLLEKPAGSSSPGGSFEQAAVLTANEPSSAHKLSPPRAGDTGPPVSPGESCPTCGHRAHKKREKTEGKPKVTFAVKVPKHDQENGHEVLTTLVEEAAKELDIVGQPPYYVLVKTLAYFLQSYPTEKAA